MTNPQKMISLCLMSLSISSCAAVGTKSSKSELSDYGGCAENWRGPDYCEPNPQCYWDYASHTCLWLIDRDRPSAQ